MNDDRLIIDLYAGPGGWDEGLAALGWDALGIEWDSAACQTALANGHARLQADVAALEPSELAGDRDLWGLIASPPCQSFSAAGKGRGRQDVPLILAGVAELAAGRNPQPQLVQDCADPRSALVLEPLRWALELEPEWIAWEQVCQVQPLWDACAQVLRADGYSVWTGTVHAEQYRVPQTRKRAVLMASRTRQVGPPPPVCSRFHPRSPTRLDPDLPRWVSMAQALGWGTTARPGMTVTAGGTGSGGGVEVFGHSARDRMDSERADGRWAERDLVGFPRLADPPKTSIEIDGVAYRERDLRAAQHPSHTVTENSRSWLRFAADEAQAGLDEISFGPRPAVPDWPWIEAADDEVADGRLDLDELLWEAELAEAQRGGLGPTEVQFVGGPQDKATVRELDQPAPTVFSQRTANMHWRFAGAGQTSERTSGQVPREIDMPAHTPTGKGTAAWVVSTGANSQTVPPGDERRADWRASTKPYERSIQAPAPTVDGKAGGAWKVHPPGQRAEAVAAGREHREPAYEHVSEPTPANDGTLAPDMAWVHTRPSPTIVGSFAPDVVAAPGYRTVGDGPRQKAKGSVRVTVAEAATLQSFRESFRVHRQPHRSVPPGRRRRPAAAGPARARSTDQRRRPPATGPADRRRRPAAPGSARRRRPARLHCHPHRTGDSMTGLALVAPSTPRLTTAAAIRFVEHCEQTLGWSPNPRAGLSRGRRAAAEKLLTRMKQNLALFTWPNLHLAVELLRRRRTTIGSPSAVCLYVDEAVRKAVEPVVRIDVAARVERAADYEQANRLPDWQHWYGRLVRARGDAREQLVTEWSHARKVPA